jgi:hypothetical protein
LLCWDSSSGGLKCFILILIFEDFTLFITAVWNNFKDNETGRRRVALGKRNSKEKQQLSPVTWVTFSWVNVNLTDEGIFKSLPILKDKDPKQNELDCRIVHTCFLTSGFQVLLSSSDPGQLFWEQTLCRPFEPKKICLWKC